MSKDQLFGLLRAVLTLAGTYLFGHSFFGVAINESIWAEIGGAILVVAAFVWTFIDKTLTLEIFQSTLLKVLMVFGGLLVTSGKITGDKLNAFVAIATSLAPIIYSFISKKKSQNIVSGDISTDKLSQ